MIDTSTLTELRYTNENCIKAAELFSQTLGKDPRIDQTEYEVENIFQEWKIQAEQGGNKSFIEHSTFLLNKTVEELLCDGNRYCQTPLIDTDNVPFASATNFDIDGLPITLLSQSDHGSVTLVHCCPFLDEFLKQEDFAKLYKCLRVNYVMTSPAKLLRFTQRLKETGKTSSILIDQIDQMPEDTVALQDYEKGLVSFGLIPQDKVSKEGDDIREHILKVLQTKKPKTGSPGEIEWHSLTGPTPYIHFSGVPQTEDLYTYFPADLQKDFNAIPLALTDKIITVGCSEPLTSRKKFELEKRIKPGTKINIVLTSSDIVRTTIQQAKSKILNSQTIAKNVQVDVGETFSAEKVNLDDLILKGSGKDAGIVELVNTIIIEAIQAKASDIHIAPDGTNTRIRYRIDGILHQVHQGIPDRHSIPIIARIKVMVKTMKLEKINMSQDGKFSIDFEEVDYDMRVNVTPVIYGEEVVIRIQKKSNEIASLASLGYQAQEQKIIKAVIDGDHGMLLICGPTGSGKCLGTGTLVAKYNGEIVPVEQIQKDDLLTGPDSKPRKVLSTNKGYGPLFLVIPKKGKNWVCNDVHVMTLIHKETKEIKDWELPQFLATSQKYQKDWELFRVEPQSGKIIETFPFTLKKNGEGDYFGFTLNGDGRFLLGDFTVTHNTTTLQAVMGMIDRQMWKVITGESPVEIRIPGVEQTPVEGALTFSEFVRAGLRRDPDYIMIGETRDRDTAQEAIRASITGHIVFTTLHTNSAYGAPGRIMDLGAEAFLLTDALKAVCAQRLIRKVCPSCQRAVPIPSMKILKEAGIKEEWIGDAKQFYKGEGCKHCFGSGSKGRIAAIEAFLLNEDMRKIILYKNADSSLLRKAMEDVGGKSIYQVAVEYAAKGICSLDEALTVNSLM